MRMYIIKAALLTISVSLLVGCAPSVGSIFMEANRQDNERAIARGKGLLVEHLMLIEKLRAEGDPMGDYLWARANADAWVPNPIKDPLVLKKMYEDAAAKGSVDAQHVLGLMLITGSSSPYGGGRSDTPVLSVNSRNISLGLATVEHAAARQCWYWEPVIAGVSNTGCLQPVVSAGRIWPKFRDGGIVEKNTNLLSRWKQLEDSCDTKLKSLSTAFFFTQKFPACR